MEVADAVDDPHTPYMFAPSLCCVVTSLRPQRRNSFRAATDMTDRVRRLQPPSSLDPRPPCYLIRPFSQSYCIRHLPSRLLFPLEIKRLHVIPCSRSPPPPTPHSLDGYQPKVTFPEMTPRAFVTFKTFSAATVARQVCVACTLPCKQQESS